MNNPTKFLLGGVLVIVLILLFLPKNPTVKIVPDTTNTGAESTQSSCSTERLPVCGDDGKTYINSCTAEKMNVRVTHVGICQEETVSPGNTDTATGSVPEVSTPVTPDVSTGSGTEVTIPVPEPSMTGSAEAGSGKSLSGHLLIPYYNANFQYGFSLPKNSYYMAFGAQNGANHSVGINTGTGVTSLSESEVRVYFYANKILEKLSGVNNKFTTDPSTGTIYILLDDKHSVMIESKNPESAIVKDIIETIYIGEK